MQSRMELHCAHGRFEVWQFHQILRQAAGTNALLPLSRAWPGLIAELAATFATRDAGCD